MDGPCMVVEVTSVINELPTLVVTSFSTFSVVQV